MKVSTCASALLTAAALHGGAARSEVGEPVLVTAPVDRAYVPMGFDNNDNVEVIVHGVFANTCYKVGPAKASVDYATSTIAVEATAYVYPGLNCATVMVPFTESVSVGMVRPGTYRVLVQDRPQTQSTELVIARATTESADDFLYAPVDLASLDTHTNGANVIRIEGSYPFTFVGCMTVKEVRIQRTPGNVLVVQPIAELLTGGSVCDAQRGSKSFKIETPVQGSLESGDYLIHVRALSGRSVNRFATLDPR